MENEILGSDSNVEVRLTPELREILKSDENQNRLNEIISKGFRTYRGEWPMGPVTFVKGKEELPGAIEAMIMFANALGLTGAVHGIDYLGEDGIRGLIVPPDLEYAYERDEAKISDAEFIASLVLAGLEVNDIT